jgi:hypothetical protein
VLMKRDCLSAIRTHARIASLSVSNIYKFMKKNPPEPPTLSLTEILQQILRSFHGSRDGVERTLLRKLAKKIDKNSVVGLKSWPLPRKLRYKYPKRKRKQKQSPWFREHILGIRPEQEQDMESKRLTEDEELALLCPGSSNVNENGSQCDSKAVGRDLAENYRISDGTLDDAVRDRILRKR